MTSDDGCPNAGTEEPYTLQLRAKLIKASNQQQQWPCARSAANLVIRTQGDGSSTLLLLAGDSGQPCQRFSDLWQLQHPASAHPHWQQLHESRPCNNSDSDNDNGSSPHHSYTPRSNSAAAIAAGHTLVVFGGWNRSGLQPLAELQVLDLSSSSSLEWHTPATTGQGPSPRGQPTAAADTAGSAVYLFGGWDGQQRCNKLFKLHVPQQQGAAWHWELIEMAGPPAAAADLSQPCARADHAMVCWHYCDDGRWKDLLVVFGGSSSSGLLGDVWLFDCSSNVWTQAFCGGPAPCARSSCAAAITGDMLLVHGGQTPQGVLHDMHLLQLSNLSWVRIDLGPILHPLCRHSMVVADQSSCVIFGGFDGSSCCSDMMQIDLQPVLQLQRSSLQDLVRSLACDGTATALPAGEGAGASAATAAAAAGPSKVLRVLSKKAAAPPMQLSDLHNAEEAAALPQWKQIRLLHQAAMAAGCDTYIDPSSGYSVFTAHYLGSRPCCGNKCRHCPHAWKNVKGQKLAASPVRQQQQQQPQLPDW